MRFATTGFLALAMWASGGGVSWAADGEASLEQRLAERGYVIGDSAQSVRSYRIDGWSVVDDRHIIINSKPRHGYLLTLGPHCSEARHAYTIGFTTKAGGLSPLDKLVLRGANGFLQQCTIQEIQELNPVAAESEPAATP